MRRGMTLVEILIVITVIVVLIGILLPAVGVLRARSRQATTMRQLEDLCGITIDRLNSEGDLPSDYDTRPAYHTVDVPLSQSKAAQLELTKEQRKGDAILDGFGTPLVIEIVRATNLGKSYIARVTIASQGRKQSTLSGAAAILGDAVANKDDLVFVYDSAKESRFVRVVR